MSRMKPISALAFTSLSLIFLAANSHAANNGFYVGGQAGWGSIHQGGITGADMVTFINTALPGEVAAIDPVDTSDDNDSGTAGRLFVGFQYNCYWGAEFGWTRFHNMSTSASASAINFLGDTVSATASGEIKTDAWDLVIKGTEPLDYGLSAYGKLGIAYLYERANANATINNAGVIATGHKNWNEGRVYPTLSLGVGYDITPKWVMDVSWNRIQEFSHNVVSSTDFYALGLAYHIS